jgi:hypothetical protein
MAGPWEILQFFLSRFSDAFRKGLGTMGYCHVILSMPVNFGTVQSVGGVVRIRRIGAQKQIRKLWTALGK